jgi:hypothetical protein
MRSIAILICMVFLSLTGCQNSDKELEIESGRISAVIKEQFSRQSTIKQAEEFMSSQGLDLNYLNHEQCLSGIGSTQVCTGGYVLQGIKTINQDTLGAKSHIIVRLYFHKSGGYAWHQVNTAHTFL